MKKIYFLLIGLLLFDYTNAQNCGNDLKEAFKTKFTLVNENEVYNHFTELFEYSEAELDQLANSYESDQSLDGSYKAVALFWSKNRSKQEFRTRFRELQFKHKAGLTIDNSFYLEYYQEVVNQGALDAYVECMRIQQELEIEKKRLNVLSGGFFYEYVGDLLTGFTFTLKKKPVSGQIESTKIVSVIPSNIEFDGSYNLKPGAILKNFTGLSQLMKLKDPNIPATLTINIEGFDPLIIEFPAYPYANFPVGSIIISTLDFNQFSKTTKNQMPFDPRSSKWAPADGRSVPGSDYEQFNTYLPDMRGQFVRGKNQFFSSGEPNSYHNSRDEGLRFDKERYSYQHQSTAAPQKPFKTEKISLVDKHITHFRGQNYSGGSHQNVNRSINYNGWSNKAETGEGGDGSNEYTIRFKGATTKSSSAYAVTGGDTETAPKNIALYYYIRINN
ncbi:hypothetical protein [Gracilimonas sediminicola]|uniref:hypothetical protein n=1 Tax=Gracilimonas sediminicola TaxID=2952158 RepID=UPI0038D3EC7B